MIPMNWHLDDGGDVDRLFALRGRFLNNWAWLEDSIDGLVALEWNLRDTRRFIDEIVIDISQDRKISHALGTVGRLGADEEQLRFLRIDLQSLATWRNALAHGKFQFQDWRPAPAGGGVEPTTWRVNRITRKGERSLTIDETGLVQCIGDVEDLDLVLRQWTAEGMRRQGLPTGMVPPPDDLTRLRSPSHARAGAA